jgi:hypothetical protein
MQSSCQRKLSLGSSGTWQVAQPKVDCAPLDGNPFQNAIEARPMKNDNIEIFDLPGFAAVDGFVTAMSMPGDDRRLVRRERTFDPNV